MSFCCSDQYIDRHVLPECIAEGGYGSPAYGLPNLLGDDSPNPWWRASANPVKKTKKVSFGDSRFSSTLSASTMDETDAISLSSDDGSIGSVSVTGSAILKGHWTDQLDGENQIFTSA